MEGSAALPDPETIRRTAMEVVSRREFVIDSDSGAGELWYRFWARLLRALLEIHRWLFKLVEGLPQWLQNVVVYGMCLIVLAVFVHLICTLASFFWSSRRTNLVKVALSSKVLDPATFERQSEEAAARGDCSLAVRLLFRACLLRLEQAESRKFRGGTTNREVLRRHRDSSIYEPMKLFVETLEIKWYGLGICSPADYEACRMAHAELVRSAKGARDVHDA